MNRLSKFLNNVLLGFFGAAFVFIVAQVPALWEDRIAYVTGLAVTKLVRPSNHNSGGTGFAVVAPSGKTYTLTNGHICAIAEDGVIHALIANTDRYHALRVVGVSDTTDLCVLEAVPGSNGLRLASSSSVGEDVALVGFPSLLPSTISKGKLNVREMVTLVYAFNSPREKCQGSGYEFLDVSEDLNYILFGISSVCFRHIMSQFTSITTFPGNSGSPTINFYGHVVGVLFAGNNSTNYGYIIPLDKVEDFLSIY